MYEHVMVETLSGMLNAISGGGGGGGVTYTLRGLTFFLFCVLYNVVSENYNVQNSLWGSIASSRPSNKKRMKFKILNPKNGPSLRM